MPSLLYTPRGSSIFDLIEGGRGKDAAVGDCIFMFILYIFRLDRKLAGTLTVNQVILCQLRAIFY